jgi:hypothetical protein
MHVASVSGKPPNTHQSLISLPYGVGTTGIASKIVDKFLRLSLLFAELSVIDPLSDARGTLERKAVHSILNTLPNGVGTTEPARKMHEVLRRDELISQRDLKRLIYTAICISYRTPEYLSTLVLARSQLPVTI